MNGRKDVFCWCLAAFFGVVIIGLELINSKNSEAQGQADADDAVADSPAPLCFDFAVDFPADTTIASDTANGRGWRQVGTFRVDVDAAEEIVNDLMARRGFVRKRTVDDQTWWASKEGSGGVRHLVQYETPTDEKVMWMLWESGVRKTGFAWGRVR